MVVEMEMEMVVRWKEVSWKAMPCSNLLACLAMPS